MPATTGILYTILTGLSWTAIGIVLSRCAKGSFDLLAYSLIQTFLSGLVALGLYSNLSTFTPSWQSLALPALILTAGIINALAQYFVRSSMQRGHHTPIWTLMQAAMLMPFAAGILFFGERPSLWGYAAVSLLLIGLFLPFMATRQTSRGWILPATIAFFLYGTLQTLYLLPSHLPLFRDAATLRPALACFGNCAGWVLLCTHQHHRPAFSRKALWVAGLMMLIHVAGVRLFFLSIDHLAQAHASCLSVPLMQSANILGFGAYSLFLLREKNSLVERLSLAAILAGFLLLSLS